MSEIAQAIADRQSEIDRLQAEIKALTDVEQILGASAQKARSTSRRSSSPPPTNAAAAADSKSEAKPARKRREMSAAEKKAVSERRVEIPRILRDIPPGKFRELIETLLGGPLQHYSLGQRNEVVENPTAEQLQQDHIPLPGNRIMILHRRRKALFETDWLPPASFSAFSDSLTPVVYLGAALGGSYLSGGTVVVCSVKWKEITERDRPVEANGDTPVEANGDTPVEVEYRAGRGGLVERIETPREPKRTDSR